LAYILFMDVETWKQRIMQAIWTSGYWYDVFDVTSGVLIVAHGYWTAKIPNFVLLAGCDVTYNFEIHIPKCGPQFSLTGKRLNSCTTVGLWQLAPPRIPLKFTFTNCGIRSKSSKRTHLKLQCDIKLGCGLVRSCLDVALFTRVYVPTWHLCIHTKLNSTLNRFVQIRMWRGKILKHGLFGIQFPQVQGFRSSFTLSQECSKINLISWISIKYIPLTL